MDTKDWDNTNTIAMCYKEGSKTHNHQTPYPTVQGIILKMQAWQNIGMTS